VDGTWSCDLVSALADGTEVNATQTDLEGNTSGPTTIEVDSTAPEAPTVVTVDGEVNTGTVVTNDTTPTLVGTGEAGAEITVTNVSGVVLGT
jgi:hypothetical protein